MRPHVLLGASGFGREALDSLHRATGLADDFVGVLDDDPSPDNLRRLEALEVPYLGTIANLVARPHRYTVAIGHPGVRRRIVDRLDAAGWEPTSIVDPTAIVGRGSRIGAGAVLCAGAIVSTNVSIGAHTHLNPGAVIGHDTVLDAFVSINPGAVVSGEVQVSSGTLIGAGSTILQGLSVAEDAVVGAAACVTTSVDRAQTVVGIPARPHPGRTNR